MSSVGPTPAPGTICPRCGVSLVTGKPAPNCATHGPEAHHVWCAEENYADDPCATCNPQEDDMTSPTQRRHEELVALLAEIRDRLPEPEVEPKCGDVHLSDIDRPCDLPSGHRGCHDSGDGSQWWHDPADHPDLAAANVAALKHETETPTRGHGECCEPADITEEPPVGSQVTDGQGDVWSRTADGWGCWEGGVRIQTITGDAWGNVRARAPLRPTTDEDRKRVGLPVEPDPADVDPDEALARVLYETECEVRWEGAGAVARDTYRDLARAAREHIYVEWNRVDVDVDGAQQDAMQAREDVERLTRERDDLLAEIKRLRAGIESFATDAVSFGDHAPRCSDRNCLHDYSIRNQRRAASLLNPTEGETDDR